MPAFLYREADAAFEADNAVLVILDLVIQCSFEIVVEIFCNNVEFVDNLLFPLLYFVFHLYESLLGLLVVLPHLFHEEMDILLRCRRILI